MAQNFSSKDTSINKNKLPAVYKKINFEALKRDNATPVILDYGAGKFTETIREYCKAQGVIYKAYDPYNGSDEDWNACSPSLIVCSNVLNVIDDDQAMKAVHDYVSSQGCAYMITVYEGNGSGIGAPTKKDCYQRNLPVKAYLHSDEICYKSIITKSEFKNFIIGR